MYVCVHVCVQLCLTKACVFVLVSACLRYYAGGFLILQFVRCLRSNATILCSRFLSLHNFFCIQAPRSFALLLFVLLNFLYTSCAMIIKTYCRHMQHLLLLFLFIIAEYVIVHEFLCWETRHERFSSCTRRAFRLAQLLLLLLLLLLAAQLSLFLLLLHLLLVIPNFFNSVDVSSSVVKLLFRAWNCAYMSQLHLTTTCPHHL